MIMNVSQNAPMINLFLVQQLLMKIIINVGVLIFVILEVINIFLMENAYQVVIMEGKIILIIIICVWINAKMENIENLRKKMKMELLHIFVKIFVININIKKTLIQNSNVSLFVQKKKILLGQMIHVKNLVHKKME